MRKQVTPVRLFAAIAISLTLTTAACAPGDSDTLLDDEVIGEEPVDDAMIEKAVAKSFSGTLLDYVLRFKLALYGVDSVTPPPTKEPALVELG
ncbi:MAG: hypothetical protein AAGC55_10695, partial [Myxococcota bacterium]